MALQPLYLVSKGNKIQLRRVKDYPDLTQVEHGTGSTASVRSQEISRLGGCTTSWRSPRHGSYRVSRPQVLNTVHTRLRKARLAEDGRPAWAKRGKLKRMEASRIPLQLVGKAHEGQDKSPRAWRNNHVERKYSWAALTPQEPRQHSWKQRWKTETEFSRIQSIPQPSVSRPHSRKLRHRRSSPQIRTFPWVPCMCVGQGLDTHSLCDLL